MRHRFDGKRGDFPIPQKQMEKRGGENAISSDEQQLLCGFSSSISSSDQIDPSLNLSFSSFIFGWNRLMKRKKKKIAFAQQTAESCS